MHAQASGLVKVAAQWFKAISLAFLGAVVFFVWDFVLMKSIFEGRKEPWVDVLGPAVVIIGILCTLGVFLWILSRFYPWRASSECAQREFSYYCQLCGYRWTWLEGAPLPPVTVRPHVLAKGAQLLDEEERQREAAYWLYQQQAKKK